MRNAKICVPLLVILSLGISAGAQSSSTVLAYIARYRNLAIDEEKRTGIPAAITLAQGIHETEAGTSELVRASNNHFGIKCKDDWRGESVSHDDDAKGECFRKYAVPEDSYRDHSDFLKTRSNYASLFQIDPTDYREWAYGLKKAGYATNPRYPQILIKLIEDYHLQDYTLVAMGKMELSDIADGSSAKANTAALVNERPASRDDTRQASTTVVTPAVAVVSYPDGEFRINDTRVVYIRKGTSYLTIAQQYEVPLSRLFDFNELTPSEVATTDQLVFIQRKRRSGEHEVHVVQPGETLISIAQAEAIRLQSLLEYNRVSADSQPAIGETLYLRARSSSPRLTSNNGTIDR
ncbi:MAG TPA: glucosaminidase domain-containing protein [Chitinophagaceae bacterium]